MGSEQNFPIQIFESLPSNLDNSNYIDFLLFLAGLKPALRIKCKDYFKNALTKWCENYSFSFMISPEKYIYIARNMYMVNLIRKIDDLCIPHEYELGILLGYPECCSKNIQLVGEENIDKWEEQFVKQSIFVGEYKLINPEGYKDGYALISHIPCSSKCKFSLAIAKSAWSIIEQYLSHSYFRRWKIWKKLK
jgi:hypothetical protein